MWERAGAHRFQMGRPRYMKIGTSAVHGMHTGPMQMKGIAWPTQLPGRRALLATSIAEGVKRQLDQFHSE